MITLSDRDRDAVGRLVHDPAATPSFETLKHCLVWPDERPTNISPAGYELLSDLWIVRGFMHRTVLPPKWGLDPAHFEKVWDFAQREIPRWPGFTRVVLSEPDRSYLDECLREGTRV